MFDHVKFGVSDYAVSKAFFLKAPEPLGVAVGRGANISDAFGHLEGSGKGRRHVKLKSVADINNKKLAQYLPLALQAASGA